MIKKTLLTLAALTVITIGAQAQSYTHSERNAQGGMDTMELLLPPPPQPKLAMFDRAMDSSNPLITMNDPAKSGHAAGKPAWNHDGQAVAALAIADRGQTLVTVFDGPMTAEESRRITSGE